MPPTGAVRRSTPPKRRKKTRTTRGPQGLPTQSTSTQRPSRPAPTPPRSWTAPPSFAPAQRKAHRKTRRARRRIPNDPKLGRTPLIPPHRLTPRQRQIVIAGGRDRLAAARGNRSVRDYYAQASPADRRLIRYIGKVEAYTKRQTPTLRGPQGLPTQSEGRSYGPANVKYRSPPQRSGASRFATSLYNSAFAKVTSGTGGVLKGPINLARSVAFETPKAYLEDPGKALSSDAQFALDAVAGLVKTPFVIAHGDGDKLVKGFKDSYSRRYGPALKGDFPKYRKVVKTEGGLPTALDATVVGSIPAKAVGILAKAGALGRTAERAVARPRPQMRESPGRVRRQRDETTKAAPNIVKVATQRNRDRARAKQAERRDVKRRRSTTRGPEGVVTGTRRLTRPAKPRVTGADLTRRRQGLERLAATGARVVRDERGRINRVDVDDNLVSVANRQRIDASLRAEGFTAKRGPHRTTYFPRREVVHRERVAGVPTGRIRERVAQRKDAARLKGIAVSSLREAGGRERQEFQQTLKGLNRHERDAVMYGTVGLVALDDPGRAVALLSKRRAQIVAARGSRRLKRFEMDELRKIDSLIANADRAFTPRLKAAVGKLREQIRASEKRNPNLALEQRVLARYGPQAQFLGVDRKAGESTSAFVKRVRAEAEKEGLPTPAFSPSEEFAHQKFSNYAVGGTKTPPPPKKRTYALQRRGQQRTDPEIVYEGIQRNLKVQHTANLVGDIFERHAHPDMRHMSIAELKRAVQREGLDPSQIAFWFPDRYRAALRGQGTHLEDLRASGEGHISTVPDDLGNFGADVHEALRGAVITVDRLNDLDQLPSDFARAKGTVIPRSVHNEVFATTKGDTIGGRLAERLKSLQSRTVLGTLNVNWVVVDTLANGFMSWLAGNVGPRTFLESQVWWKKLPAKEKAALGAQLDVGRMRSQTYIPHMGATVNTGWVNTWRALRRTPVGSEARPLTKALSALMRAQPVRRGIDRFLEAENKIANDPFRRAVAFNLLRKEAFQRMDARQGVLNGQINRLVGLMHKPPHEQMQALLKEPGMIEDIARGVDEALGDFHSFTSIERRTIGRYLFFYPYARFATRLLFYTLPTKHPVKLSLAARIGSFTEEEQRELLGVTRDEAKYMRPLMFGRVFYKDSKSPTGFGEQNIASANPLGNPITESEGTQSLWGTLAPWMQWAVAQIDKRDVFRGRPWNIGGETTNPFGSPDLGSLPENLSRRGRILFRSLLELSVPTRELSKHFLPGEQSSESLPGLEVPMRYKSAERQFAANQRRQRDLDESLPEQILRDQLRLFFGKPSDIMGQLERRRESLGLPAHPGGDVDPRETERLLRGADASGEELDADEIEKLLRGAGVR